MADFSVISSTLSPKDIADFVREKYSLRSDTTGKLIKAGINHTYRIDSEKKTFIFRVYSFDWRTKNEISEELNLLLLLKEKELSVSYPIADDSENFIQTINAPEGLRYAVLFSFALGKKILNFGKEVHFEIGKTMAQIHQHTRDLSQKRITYTPAVLIKESVDYIKQFLPEETEEMQFLVATQTLLEKELLEADNSLLRKGIVHLDIWFDNLNISETNKITLFDFDFCGNGWLCLDIAYYAMQLFNTEKDEKIRTEKTNAFYEGYESVEKISSEEKRLLPILGICIFYFYLGIQCKRFDNYSNIFINEVYIKRFITIYIKDTYEKIKQ